MNTPETSPHMSLLDSLAHNASGTAKTVIVGLNWTLVCGLNSAGLAHTPARGTAARGAVAVLAWRWR